MDITILGTGMVGQVLATKLLELGHDITIGTRKVNDTIARDKPNRMTGISFMEWYDRNSSVKLADYPDSINHADLVINATSGVASLDVLEKIGKGKLAGKILLDIANPLDFSRGMPPSLSICNDDSLGETLQRSFPDTKVVKGLNTMNAYIMVNPRQFKESHNVFICGNDNGAKETVKQLLTSFGWKDEDIVDMGDISNARGTEQLLPIWIRLMNALGTAEFNFKIVKNA